MPGSDPNAGVIVIGGHLDSWDMGTGAIDNAAGVAITAAAAHRIMQAGQPRRTIRVVLFGAEEVGGGGGPTHFRLHSGENNVVLVGESDFGADRVWRVNFNFGPGNAALADRITALLAPLGILRGRELPHPIVVKLDAQGSEVRVLEGARETLAKSALRPI